MAARKFLTYFFSMAGRPRAAVDALANETSVLWGVLAALLGTLQVWGNMALHALFDLDWLGTRGLLPDPTLVAGFGHWQVNLDNYVPVLAGLMPFLSLAGLVLSAGCAHLLSKLWGGQGSFEQMVNTLAFASAVPGMLAGAASEWLFGVPIDLLSGHPYWWAAAMGGEFGQASAAAWNFFVFGIYLSGNWCWQIGLGSLAIRRVQRIPAGAALICMCLTFGLVMFFWSAFIR